MDDAKRLVRYVIPGIVFIVEVSFYLFVSARPDLIETIKASGLLNTEKSGIAVILAALLTSGGLGYIFSNLYYVFHIAQWGIVDHTDLLKDAEQNHWLTMIDNQKCERVSKNDAWRIVTALWKSRLESSLRIKSSDDRMDSLADIMHGLGTSAMASIFALFVWMHLHCLLTSTKPWSGSGLSALMISIVMIVVFIINYVLTRRNIQGIVYIILSEELRERVEKPKENKPTEKAKPLIIHYKICQSGTRKQNSAK